MLVDNGMKKGEAHSRLKGTFSKDKHEMLFAEGINYNEIEAIYRKGTTLIRVHHNGPKNGNKPGKRSCKKEVKAEKGAKHAKDEGKEEGKAVLAESEEEASTQDPSQNAEGEEKKNEAEEPEEDPEIVSLHEDLVEKAAFYEKYDLFSKLL